MPCDKKQKPATVPESAFIQIRNIIAAEIKAGRWVGAVVGIKDPEGGTIVLCNSKNHLKSDLRGLPTRISENVKDYDYRIGNQTPDPEA